MKPIAVIPSRYASVRFPGKPLAPIAGKPMVQHVYERCVESGAFARVFVATDDDRIAQAVRGFGGDVAMTSPSCPSGTDRVAEVAKAIPHAQVLVNVQGDEPLIAPEGLRELAKAFDDPKVELATLIRPLDEDERQNPNVVKVALAANGDALYFSRADIPFDRDAQLGSGKGPARRYGHIGIYGYRRETLLRIATLEPTPLELTERLEQLRAMENGIRIHCRFTEFTSIGVDTPEDLKKAEALYLSRRSGEGLPTL